MSRTSGLFIGILFLILSFPAVCSNYYICDDTKQCGLQGDNTYRNIVLGPVVDVANAKQTEKVFKWARSQGYWKELPNDVDTFIKKVQIISVEVPVGRKLEQVSLLMGRKDFERSIIKPGDYIRYTPRDPSFFSEGYTSPEKDAYWKLYGCIAVLCSAEDTQCPLTYQSGIYRHADGISLDLDTGEESKNNTGIDPQTYLPIKLPSNKK